MLGGMSDLTIPEYDPPPTHNQPLTAEEAKRNAIRQVDENADQGWKETAYRVIWSLAREREFITTDDVWEQMAHTDAQTHEARAMGAVMQQAARGGAIKSTGDYRPSIRTQCHARPVRVWRSLLWAGNMTARTGKQPEVFMLSERQADILIDGQRILVDQVARTLDTDDENTDRKAQAEKVIGAVADWLSDYRPADLGDEYISPLDLTAFILRKGQFRER